MGWIVFLLIAATSAGGYLWYWNLPEVRQQRERDRQKKDEDEARQREEVTKKYWQSVIEQVRGNRRAKEMALAAKRQEVVQLEEEIQEIREQELVAQQQL